MEVITSDGGRIGQLWWINSNTQPRRASILAPLNLLAITWGTFGFGSDLRISWEVLERRRGRRRASRIEAA